VGISGGIVVRGVSELVANNYCFGGRSGG